LVAFVPDSPSSARGADLSLPGRESEEWGALKTMGWQVDFQEDEVACTRSRIILRDTILAGKPKD